MKIGSLFTGYGGLDMAVEQHFDADTVWVSDIDPGACKIIQHHWPDIPNLGDITTVDWEAVEPVDILCGGWPCQPFSLAGKRKGAQDERALWPEVAKAVRTIQPQHIVLENVAAITTAGELGRATSDLATLRYVGQWRCLRAADVGAPHGRARIFIIATNANDIGCQRSRRERGPDSRPTDSHLATANTRLLRRQPGRIATPGQEESSRTLPLSGVSSRALVAYPESAERGGTQPKHLETPTRSATEPGERVSAAADADSTGGETCGRRQGNRDAGRCEPLVGSSTPWGEYEPAIRRWEHIIGRSAPAPTEPSRNGGQRLSPHFVEWMMGLPPGWVTDVPNLPRNAQLKALGNGVVPQQALAALELMQ